jgi:DNA-directed RNA polymerase specialized sigma subunit
MVCSHYYRKLNKEDRYYVNSEKHNNCMFCLVSEKGEMTQEEVSQYFGISKMRVCQLEKLALKKFRKKMKKITE